MHMEEKTEWELGIGFVALGIAVGAGLIILVRYTDLPREPWVYLGVAIAMFSVVCAFILAIIRARETSG
jgi:hypothetical protein